ncbi:LacI family DNA-binding transcriptional regulator [Arthrobacter sp. StoSoilB5]|uniref:LacI family DNA-binding transcriptional regulator n=1 Tax=Arthrobacter sp. StoSoilB5 TaxID=2830992 RepID=UPI001CC727E5|nr:LacI family DNA-binding transcriptional regulator [Arthrobacter sp. StoSoilB5]BCW43556.1 LacI family transcriptional regulator [Arthrobacter sp. StoSoilB5]
MAVTINDVANAAGVSKGAVSYALNGQPGVSEGTRTRILQVAKELGWKPSLRAKGLSSSKAYALGLVVARDAKLLSTDPFFPAFIAGIETTLVRHEYTLVLSIASGPEAEEKSYRKLVEDGRVDGVILTDMRNNDSRIALLGELELPAVTLNRPDTRSPFPAVCMDDTDGITSAVKHLISLGHTRIAHVGGPQPYVHSRSRHGAWARTLESAGLGTDLFIEADFTAAGGAAATESLLSRPNRPTAIVYANDLMAIAGQSLAQTRGFNVPEDLSVTGYDNTEITQYLNPPLTTISTDPLLWGQTAAQLLLNRLNGTPAEDILLQAPRLLIRGSTGPVSPAD